MAGYACGSGLVICTEPRLVGRRLQTDGVIAGNEWSGSPNLSRLKGWTCHSMFALGWAGSLLANAPSWDGGIVSGPVRKRKYSRPIRAFPTRLLARSFRVRTLWTLYIIRIWRWS